MESLHLHENDPKLCTPLTMGMMPLFVSPQGVYAYTFLTEMSHRAIGAVQPLPLQPAGLARPSTAPRAIPALQLPSKALPPPEAARLALPRVVAVPPQPQPPRPPKALVYRQVRVISTAQNYILWYTILHTFVYTIRRLPTLNTDPLLVCLPLRFWSTRR